MYTHKKVFKLKI